MVLKYSSRLAYVVRYCWQSLRCRHRCSSAPARTLQRRMAVFATVSLFFISVFPSGAFLPRAVGQEQGAAPYQVRGGQNLDPRREARTVPGALSVVPASPNSSVAKSAASPSSDSVSPGPVPRQDQAIQPNPPRQQDVPTPSGITNQASGQGQFLPWALGTPGGDVGVVVSEDLVPSLKRWATYRQSQGYRIHMLVQKHRDFSFFSSDPNAPSPESIRAQIRELAQKVPLKAVLIVGDGAPLAGQSPSPDDPLGSALHYIPAPRVETQVIDRFGPEKHIASDGWYADLDGDDLPDIAIGRIPARTPGQVEAVTDKVIYYEKVCPPGEWQRNVSIIAGVGGFSPIVDNVINGAVRRLLSSSFPGDFEFLLAMANWKSPYCPDPALFRFTTIDQINRGPLFWIYMGHGLHQELDRLSTPKGNFKIMEIGDMRHVECKKSLPIMVFCACYTGAYDSTETSISEELLLAPKGPVAVLGASRTSMPYGMAVFGVELLEEAFQRGEERGLARGDVTMGELVMAAKRRMVPMVPEEKGSKKKRSADSAGTGKENRDPHGSRDGANGESSTVPAAGSGLGAGGDGKSDSRSPMRKSLDGMARMFDPTNGNLGGQLADHRNLFNLFGDPLLRVRFPKKIWLDAPDTVQAGETVTVSSTPRGMGQDETSRLDSALFPDLGTEWSADEGGNAVDNHDGAVLVELVSLPSRPKFRGTNRDKFVFDDKERIKYQRTFEEANNRILSSTSGLAKNGEWSVELAIPEGLSGNYCIRAMVTSPLKTETGARRVWIRKPESQRAKERDAGKGAEQNSDQDDNAGVDVPET